MKGKLTLVFLLISLILKLPASAQDPHFSQFHNNKLYLNPAFAGSSSDPEFSLGYRNQWPSLTGTFVTSMFSYNQYIQKLGGGIGAYSIYDNAAEGTLTSLLFNVVYAAHIELKNVVIQPAITVGYRTKHIEKDKLTFGDLIDPRYGFVYPTTTATDFSSERNFFDFGTGILCYTKTIYAGFSLDHLSEPEESFISPSPGSKLPRKYSFNAGFNIPSGDSGLWAFNPEIVFQRQRDFEEWIVSMTVKYSCMRAGVGVRKGDAIILLFGVQGERISASYSYDITTSSLSTASGGSHEISLLYRLRNKSSNGKRIALNSIAF